MNKTVLLTGLDGDDKILVSHVMDLAERAERTGTVTYSPFLNPREARLAKGFCRGGYRIEEYGGYDGAERVQLAFCPFDYDEPEFPVRAVRVKTSDGRELSHRAYLGAVLSLGIKREKIGDIAVNGGEAIVLCHGATADFICMNLSRVASSTVKCEMCSDEIRLERRYDISTSTVASMRLDCVLSAALGKSREASCELIKGGLVQVNYEEARSPSAHVKSGDTISARGFGKMVIEADGSETRKGRARITIKKLV